MTLKKSYKIIISIIILAILISAMAIYLYPYNNTEYYNNGMNIDVKYPASEFPFPYYNSHYNISSYSVKNNKISYLNSSVINPDVYPDLSRHGMACLFINISTYNINSKYADITFTGSDLPCVVYYNTSSHLGIISESKYQLTVKALEYKCINAFMTNIGSYSYNNYYNFTVKVSTGKLTNTYYITTQVQSALYGCVEYPHTGTIDRVNGEFIIQNENNSHMNIVNVHNGYYYYFVHPYTGYRIYSIKNSTLKQIGTIGNKTISSGSSYRYVIYSDDL